MENIINYLQEKGTFPCSILFNDAEGNDCTLKSVSIENDTVIFCFEDFLCMECQNTLDEVLNSSYAQIWDIVSKEIGKAIEFAKPKAIEVEKTATPAINIDAIARLTGSKESFKFADIPRELWGYAVQTWEAMELGKEYAYTIVSISENLTFSCLKREVGLIEKVVGKSKKGNDLVERVRKPSLEVLLQVDSIPKHVLSSFSKLEQAKNDLAREKAAIKLPKCEEKTSCIMTAKNFLSMLKKAEAMYKTEASFFKDVAQIMMYNNGTYFSGLSNMQGEDVANIENDTWKGAQSMLIPLNMDKSTKLSNMVAQLPNCNLEIVNTVETYEDDTTIQRFYFTSPFGKYEVALDIADNALFTIEQLGKNATIETSLQVQIQASEFRGAINTCSNFVSKDELKPAICGVLVDMFAGKFVATNAHVLVVVPIEIEKMFGQVENFILPIEEVKAFLATVSVLSTDYVTISLKGIFAKLSCGNSSSIVRLIQASYPDYNAVMPTNNDNKVSILKHDLQKSLRRIKPYCNPSAPIVSMSFSQNCLTLSGSNAHVCQIEKFDSRNGAITKEYRYINVGEHNVEKEEFYSSKEEGIETVEVETLYFLSGKSTSEMLSCTANFDLSVSFNVEMLITCISTCVDENIQFNLNSSPNRGCLIESSDKTILIMPVMGVEQMVCPPNTKTTHKVEYTETPTIEETEEEFENWTTEEVQAYEDSELGE